MREYSNAPSKATKKKLKEVANSLRESFAIMERKGYHDFSFLSDSDPVERAVKQHCREKGYKLLLSNALDERAIDRIRHASGDDVLKEFLLLIPNCLGSILAPVIVSLTVAIQSEDLREKAISQAALLASSELGQRSPIFWTCLDRNPSMAPLQLYNGCVETFPKLFQNTVDFLNSPETVAWKEEHGQGFGQYTDPAAAAVRLEVILNRIWYGPTKAFEPLLKRDFKEVLKIIWNAEVELQALHGFN